MNERGSIYVDVDGTLNLFKREDNFIINKIFGKHKAILFLDKILWKINDLDLICNSMFLLKVRILMYSILSFTSFKVNIKRYEVLYIIYTMDELDRNYRLYLKRLEALGYDVHLITHNEFTKAFRNFPIKVLKSKQDYIRNIYKEDNISYMIGNNYNDLRIAIKLGIKSIYIGKSEVVAKIISGKAEKFANISEAVDFIEKSY